MTDTRGSASSDPAAPRSASSDPSTPPYASPVDYEAYGLYGAGRGFDRGRGFPGDYEGLRQAMVAMLEELDGRLAGRRFLFGEQITEADVRLWPTLARFDTASRGGSKP